MLVISGGLVGWSKTHERGCTRLTSLAHPIVVAPSPNKNGTPQGAVWVSAPGLSPVQAQAAAFTFNRQACSSGSV